MSAGRRLPKVSSIASNVQETTSKCANHVEKGAKVAEKYTVPPKNRIISHLRVTPVIFIQRKILDNNHMLRIVARIEIQPRSRPALSNGKKGINTSAGSGPKGRYLCPSHLMISGNVSGKLSTVSLP